MGRNTQDLLSTFAANVKASREKLGYSQMKLADEADLSVGYINDLEQGRKWVSRDSLEKLCDALLVEPWMLLMPEQPAVAVQDADLMKHLALRMQRNLSVTVAETLQQVLGGLLRGEPADTHDEAAESGGTTPAGGGARGGDAAPGGAAAPGGVAADTGMPTGTAGGGPSIPLDQARPRQDPFGSSGEVSRDAEASQDSEPEVDLNAAPDAEGAEDRDDEVDGEGENGAGGDDGTGDDDRAAGEHGDAGGGDGRSQ